MDKQIGISQELYYRGLGWGSKTRCWKICEEDGVRYVYTNCGVKRKEEDVLNNTCDLYSDKEEINKRLRQGWRTKLID
ncbi:hypothetical protein ACR77J_07505 [Tissierella praeacuta]|uniref:hypothetical protein n=1 Tax=Tissierella praeacuta TaxID=43131 RepID=UPI003DA62809